MAKASDENAREVARLIDAGKHAEAECLYRAIMQNQKTVMTRGRWSERIKHALGESYAFRRTDGVLGMHRRSKAPAPAYAISTKTA
jgi:hypothetical protein